MTTRQISVRWSRLMCWKKFEEVVAKLSAGVGHPDVRGMFAKIGAAKTYAEVEKVVQPGLGPTGLMEFMRFDLCEVLRKAQGEKAPKSVRFLIGNALIMKKMVEHVPDAGSYAPVTILVDERAGGGDLFY